MHSLAHRRWPLRAYITLLRLLACSFGALCSNFGQGNGQLATRTAATVEGLQTSSHIFPARGYSHEYFSASRDDGRRDATRELRATVSGGVGRSSGAQLTRASPGGTLFSWGLKEWRLARMTGDVSIPEPALANLTVISVAASRHSAIVTNDGVVWTMGHNDSRGGGGHGSPPLDASGQLGRGGSREPGPVEGPLKGKFVVQAVTGRYHTMAVTADGELYSWGLNDWGQLGRPGVGATSERDPAACFAGPSCRSGVPGLVKMPGGVKVVGAAAGRYVSMAVDEAGRLYTWGHDGCSNGGQLPKRAQAYEPRLVDGELATKRVVAFDAGYVFWIAATAEGEVYTCNSQDDGYAGTLSHRRPHNNAGELGREGDPLVPGLVAGALAGQKVEVVAAGREHALVATADGKVYSWGGRDLLTGRPGNSRAPGQTLGALQGDNIRFVSAGEYHSGAASETKLYGWGTNTYFSTGVGRGNPVQKLKPGAERGDVFQPAVAQGVIARGGWQVQALVAGFQHGLAIAANQGGSWPVVKGGRTTGARELGDTGSAASDPQSQDHLAASDTGAGATTAAASDTAAAASASAAGSGGSAAASTGASATVATQSQGHGVSGAHSGDYRVRYLLPQIQAPAFNASEYWRQYIRSPRLELIKAQSPDIWKVLPAAFDPRFKNPCWHQGDRFRCIPFYHILGVSKCGTTDLYHRLSKHPQLFKSRNKGPHWWDECINPPVGPCTAPPNGDFDGYVDLFADAADKILRDPQGITGEASSNTFTSAAGVYLRGPSMDRKTDVTMPELMREASPFLRNIVIFRNPVDRYFSSFYYYRRWDRSSAVPGPQQFHKVAKQEIDAWNACVNSRGMQYCVRHYSPQQLVKGMYSEFVGDWLKHWPRNQLLFLRNEDYSKRPREHMVAVFKFLGVREPTEAEWLKIVGMETRNRNSNKYAGMLPETRALLEEFYRPFNERLAQVLGDDRWLWRDGATASSITATAA